MARVVRVLLAATLGAAGLAVPAEGQSRTGIDGEPPARWVADSAATPDAFGVFHFRRVLELPSRPEQFVVQLSADNRYRFFVNGQFVSAGPQRSDLMHWRHETVDLAPYLRAGPNVLAATVWNWGAFRPVGQQSRRTAFLLRGVGDAAVASTGVPGWKVLRDSSYAPVPVTGAAAGGYYAASPGEAVDARKYPWGWEAAGYADSTWPAAASLEAAQDRGTDAYGLVSTWQLVPRSIPPMEETIVRFAAVRRASGVRPDGGLLRGDSDLVVPARTRAVVLLDEGQLTDAFFTIETSGGEGSTVALTYAESLRDSSGRKGDRNAIHGKTIVGLRDSLRLDGGAHRIFRTLWFRTWRYVQMEIQTAEAPLRVHDVHGVFTAYPYRERGRFTSDAPWIDSVWAMNWRTARLCAWETYFDTPYYEQLQYIGDTRVQGLISLYVGGDDRLVRNAIEQFDGSRLPDGLTASRYPAALPQYIPPFSLLWVAMVHDYWMLRDDPAFVRRFLPGTRAVLGWFDARVDSTGLVGALPWWGFVDWAEAWERGAPPGAERGHSIAITLQYIYALDRAAAMEETLGSRELATRYRGQAASLRAAVRAQGWDSRRGLFRDSPDSASYSQQTNALAVLAGVVPPGEQQALMTRVLADTTLVRASYYFDYYVFEALRDAGLGDRYVEQLAPWRAMLAAGLTTTPEAPEPSRSDSHAWSAHPDYGLLATVLGVRPGAPGFRSVIVAPHLGPLTRAEGRVPHPRGDIDVRLTRAGAHGLRAVVTLPQSVSGTLEWQGRRVALHAGRQELALGATVRTATAQSTAETLRLPKLFADGMVVQRGARIPVWGWAPARSTITARFRGHVARATSDSAGRWSVAFPASAAGGPYTLTVGGAGQRLTVANVMVGDVWVASGQSNMEFNLSQAANAADAIASAHDSLIREFKVPVSWAERPTDDIAGGSWSPADPQHVGNFSAVAYFFARELRASEHVPIGILNSSWGGSAIQTWLSAEAQGMGVDGPERALASERARIDSVSQAMRARFGNLEHDSGLVNGTAVWAAATSGGSGWSNIAVPGLWEQQGYADLDGIAWYRTSFTLAPGDTGRDATLALGTIDDDDITWVNGVEVGRTKGYNVPRRYTVPASALHAGMNVIAVRVTDTGGGGGIYGAPELLRLEIGGASRPLAGNWKFRIGEIGLEQMDGQRLNKIPAITYNRMVHPLLPVAIKGVIWYQGESNADNETQARAYREQFRTLITSWRHAWNGGAEPRFPFLWVQLPNFGQPDTVPTATGGAWAIQRESMAAALALPNTGQAITIDIGEPNDIHPKDKLDVGKRLALVARKVAYGEHVLASGPSYRAHTVSGGRVIVEFANAGSGLVSRGNDGSIGAFAIAGADRHFVRAQARVEGNRVVVWSDQVAVPVAVRYAWSNSPVDAKLYNREGLPAAPFRTDAW